MERDAKRYQYASFIYSSSSVCLFCAQLMEHELENSGNDEESQHYQLLVRFRRRV